MLPNLDHDVDLTKDPNGLNPDHVDGVAPDGAAGGG
jgi:hypothetical protein